MVHLPSIDDTTICEVIKEYSFDVIRNRCVTGDTIRSCCDDVREILRFTMPQVSGLDIFIDEVVEKCGDFIQTDWNNDQAYTDHIKWLKDAIERFGKDEYRREYVKSHLYRVITFMNENDMIKRYACLFKKSTKSATMTM